MGGLDVNQIVIAFLMNELGRGPPVTGRRIAKTQVLAMEKKRAGNPRNPA